ncbi:FliM/FliN family flagellar motor switch protein [Parerythrobacter jejuensis]|uniref:Flagellar motor switch protein FliN-like C-terminal domain-containing protein n=1 Tax=Parerythrobacter jejuensis TaxID=795812 RepID=A0A845AUW0_9SPHN|nr:FliM/FliN family flagellar motor switch protein [Parerythrobacter jejuensis]MXP30618.1 hypothetical protein [Parerythrobacter jejuensis]MXP33378.1 hypothetical protein [Parerythrobacter jejuensis]
MKTTHDFVAERALANHCPQLLENPDKGEERRAATASFLTAACHAIPDRLQPLLLAKRPVVEAGEAETQTAASLMRSIGSEAANFAVDMGPAMPRMLVSIDLATAVSLTDRLFGGDGKTNGEVPASLPLSASLALERVVLAVSESFITAARIERQEPDIVCESDIARLAPFPRGEYCVSWTFKVTQEGSDVWSMQIALLESDLGKFSGSATKEAVVQTATDGEDPSGLGSFGLIPLPLIAVLAELKLPLDRLSSLAAGDILPLAPARSIPLQLGSRTIARGAIGTLDERVALQLS